MLPDDLFDPAPEDDGPERRANRPAPELIRGVCPQCGEDLVADVEYVPLRGYVVSWRCWGTACSYRLVR